MPDMTVLVTIDKVAALENGPGVNIAATSNFGVAMLLTAPYAVYPEGTTLVVDVTAIPEG